VSGSIVRPQVGERWGIQWLDATRSWASDKYHHLFKISFTDQSGDGRTHLNDKFGY